MPDERLAYQDRLDSLLQVYDDAQKALADQVHTAIANGQVFTAEGRRAQLAALLHFLDELGRRTDPVARQLVANAYMQSAQRTATQVAGLDVTYPEIPGTFTSINQPAIQALENSLLGQLQDARRTVGRQVDDIFARAQRRAAIRALTGELASPDAAAKAMAHDLADQGIAGFVDRSGKRWGLDTYSRMATRTVTRQAVVHGSIDRMLSHGIDLARVSDHNTKCPICKPWENRLIALGGNVTSHDGEKVWTTDDGIPPIHPNCEHTLLPVASSVEQFRADLAPAA